MADPTRIWFIRHGEVEGRYVGTFTGSTDVGISDVGRHQAEAVARFMDAAHVDAIVSSPMRRALDSAMPLAKATGLRCDIRDDLREMDFGAWETLTWAEIEARDEANARAFRAAEDVRSFPGGEDTEVFAERVQADLEAILDAYAGRSVAVFAHAGTNRAILAHLTGLPYLDTFVFAQDYGCVNAAGWDPHTGFGQLAMLNVVPGPMSEQHGDGGRRVPHL